MALTTEAMCTTAAAGATLGLYRGHVYYGGGWRDPWLAPLVVGATVGTAVYLSRSYPAPVVVSQPSVVYVNPPVYPSTTSAVYTSYDPYAGFATTTVSAPVPVAEAYYCREAGQYYPAVQTCPSPWMLVRTP
jgi:hypothetical protein